MKINKENYGRFIVDYYDGQLSPEEEQILMLFLDRYPELKKEFESFENFPVLRDELLEFSGKQTLKREEITAFGGIDEDNYPEYFVLSQDGELPSGEEHDLENFLKINPHLQGEYHRFGLAKVSPDTSVVFENKAHLKKRVASFWLPYVAAAAAAVLLLFIGFRFLFPGSAEHTTGKFSVAVNSLPVKTVHTTLVEVSPKHIRKQSHSTKAEKKIHSVRKRTTVIPVRRYKPVKMLASADIYMPLKPERDYAPLLFPEGKEREEILALSSPVVVEQTGQNNFLRHTIGKPFSQLAAVFALQKKKRKNAGVHDKGFVKVLERGVNAMNVLTDNDVVMVKTYDADGNLIDYQLLSDNFSINRPVRGKGSR